MQQTAILVLGMHRSGTSALTGTLGLLDVYLGSELMEGNIANQKGYFENNHFYKINEKLLSLCESSWDDIFYNEDKFFDLDNINELKSLIKKEFKYSQIFAIKDPRLVYLFPIYRKALEELNINIKIILPFRNPIEVANSLHKRDSMSLEKGMLLWAYHFLLAEKYSRGFERIFINFDNLISDTKEVVHRVSEALHIDLDSKYVKNKQKIIKFLEPSLKHHNISMDNLSNSVPSIIQKIIAQKDKFNAKTTSKIFDKLRNELFDYQKLFYNDDILNLVKEFKQTKEILLEKEQSIRTLTEELTNKEQSIRTLTEELSNKEQSIRTLTEELSNKEQSIQTLSKELTSKEQSIQTLSKELTNKEQSIQTLSKELTNKEQKFENLTEELTNLYTSKSWKLTRPLRSIMRVLKKL